MKILKGKTLVASFGINFKHQSECSAKGDSVRCAIDECCKKFFSEKLEELEVIMKETAAVSIDLKRRAERRSAGLYCIVNECHEIIGDYFIPVQDIYLPDIPTELPEGRGLFVLQGFELDSRCPDIYYPAHFFFAVPFGKYKLECPVLEYEIKQGDASVVHVVHCNLEEDWPEGFVLPEDSLVFDTEIGGWIAWNCL